ncbi:MAG: monophosphatase [Gaiellales bacterium]|nr:monophosphatase [Gaiellales bacterium]
MMQLVADPSELLALAERAARAAGDLLRARAAVEPTGLAYKSSDTDPVSDADRDAEAQILRLLHAERPNDAVLGEEGTSTGGSSGLRWVIDPLDGTVNFLYAQPNFAVSIACQDSEGTLAGVVHEPLSGETFTAVRGGGAWRDGVALAVNRPDSLARALVATGFSYEPARRALQGEIVARLLPEVRDLRRAGSAALDLAWVACGRLDGFYEHGLNEWDLAAGALLVSEAGGVVRRLPATDDLPEALVAGAPNVVQALVEQLARA